MNILDTRSRDVLTLLLREHAPLTIGEIAARLRLTSRMLRSSLDLVDGWLRAEGFALQRKPNVGVWVEVSEETRQRLLRRLEQSHAYLLHLSTTEREEILTFLLLSQAGEPVQAAQLEVSLGVSRPTLLKDMTRVEAWLSERRLALARRGHAGFNVIGPEESVRAALVGFILDHLGSIQLLALFNSPKGAQDLRRHVSLNRAQEMLIDYLQQVEPSYAASLVVWLEKELNRRFTDESFAELACHLALIPERNRRGFGLSAVVKPVPDPCGSDQIAVRRIVAELGAHFDLDLPEAEKTFLCLQVTGAKLRYSVAELMNSPQLTDGRSDASQVVAEIVDDASLYLHPYLKVDQQLIRGLSYHIEVALSRLRNHLPIRNPLLAAIKEQYPQIYRIAERCSEVLARRTGVSIPEEEIGYLAMHLGAAMERLRPFLGLRRKIWIICSEGVATAWLLVSRLRAELPEAEVVEVTSALEISHQPPRSDEVDLILSTVPIQLPGFPVLQVSPLLNNVDLQRIRETLQIGQTPAVSILRKDMEQPVFTLTDLVPRTHIRLKVNAHTWEEVVEKAGAPLLAEGAIDARYVTAMKDVIREYGPYMVFAPGVVLLHARPENGVNRLCLSMVTLQTPVAFGHPHHDPVSLAIVLGVMDHKSHLRALSELAEHVSDPRWVERVRAASTPADVLRLLAASPAGKS